MQSFYRIPRPVIGVLLLCLFFNNHSIAQRSRGLRCPTPKRQKTYTVPPQVFADVSGGIMLPVMYRNTGHMEPHFHFKAQPGPYLAATGHLKYPGKLELTLGAELMHNQQGLVMKYDEGDANVKEAGYTSSLIVRVPAGVGYYISPSWTVNAAAFVAYSTYWSYTSNGRQSLTGNGASLASQHAWNVPGSYSRWYPGISLSTQAKIARRLSGKAFCSMDFAQATPNAGSIDIITGGSTQTVNASLEPYLMNVGVGLSYRLGKLKE